MKGLERELKEEKKKIEELLFRTNKELKLLKTDNCKIKVLIRGKALEFYIKEPGKNVRYLPVSEKDRAVNSVGLEYYGKLKRTLERRLNIVLRTIRVLNATNPSQIYEKLGKGKQRLIEPIESSDEQYRREWEKCEYKGKSFGETTVEIYTDKGERVRSKSEKIIADKLYREDIAYRYEYPLVIPHVGILYPDFTILDEINRRNVIYEHFGLMDNKEYANQAISKLQLYASAGYVLGDNLFITMETSEKPFDSRMIDGIIKQIKHNDDF